MLQNMSILIIITIIFSSGYILLILYYLYGWESLKEFIPTQKNLSTKITVIIPARNEGQNLPDLLGELKDQTYSAELFEIIVVDDFSEDNTVTVVKKSSFPNIKLLQLKDFIQEDSIIKSHKKKAIEIAVQQATGELIITTDADCHVTSRWLNSIAHLYEAQRPAMIAGPVNFFYDSSFLGKFQTLDFLSMVGIAAASIKNGFSNLCNGANLAFTKEAFNAVDGYRDIDHIPTGDDMMLMHKMARKYPGKIAFLKDKDAIVYTHTEKDFSSFWQQRLRWASKSTSYEDRRITYILIFAYAFNLLLLINFFLGLFQPVYLRVAMFQFLTKICLDTIFTYSVAKFFRRENLLWLFLPMQVAHVTYVLFIAPLAVFGTYKWKGRKINMNK